MKRLGLLVGLLLLAMPLWSQPAQFAVRIQANDPNVRFRVDGVEYYGQASFFWTENSQHFLFFPSSKDGFQYLGGPEPAGGNEILARTRYVFSGWEDPTGTLELGSGFYQTVFAHPKVNLINVEVVRQYEARLNFWNAPASELEPAAGVCAPDVNFGPGVLLIGESCYWRNTRFWLDEGATLILQAIAFPGWAFREWGINNTKATNFMQEVVVMSSMEIAAIFRPAKRVKFLTDPLGYNVMVDGAMMATPPADPCRPRDLAPAIFEGAPQRCIGEVDWAVGSQHVIGVPEPQDDSHGTDYVFHSFSTGGDNHSIYEVTSQTPPETIVAKLVPGARVSFLTKPTGLKIEIDGRDDWLANNFIVAPGRVFQLNAPGEQLDAEGRNWVFAGWSNGGDQVQEVTIPQSAVDKGYILTANYELLARLVIETTPRGIPIEVDGVECKSPCPVDREDGVEVTVSVPARQQVSGGHRRDFVAWSDGGPRTRTVTIGGDEPMRLKAEYKTMFQLAASSVPEGGADFQLSPPSEDGFYEQGESVQVTAAARDGFRFRRWGGDLEGTRSTGNLTMSRERSVIAMLDEIEVAPEAFVQNAAGETPEPVVAPNSIISIYSETLAPGLQVGPTNPLAQTLLNTTVSVSNRILGLLFVSPNQINAVLHPDTAEGPQKLVVTRPGQLDIETTIQVARNAPGLFSRFMNNEFYVMASHADGTPVTPDSPARRGEVISIYGTGFGPYDRIAPYGFAIPNSPAFSLIDTVEVLAGDIALQAESAAAAPGYSGTDLLELRIDDRLPAASTLELRVRINGRESNRVLLPVE